MIKENVTLAPYTYYKIGGTARYFAEPQTLDDLKEVSKFLKEKKVPYFVLGSGSNILFHDDGFDGLIIHTGKISKKISHENNILTLGTSVTVSQALRYAGQNGLGGLEFLVGVPGNAGGTIFMNAGTKGGDIDKIVQTVTVYNLKTETTETYTRDKISYGYRTQKFLAPHDLVLEGQFKVALSDPKVIQQSIQSQLAARKASQPIDKPSCGSVFKNPDPAKGINAWKLISDAGLRGKTIGGAQISDLHTNFIINLGQAKAADVKELINDIKVTIKNRFGISMEEEVRIVDSKGSVRIT